MSKALTTREIGARLEQVLIQGDLAPMTEPDRIAYVKALCKAVGVSILFRPFDFIKFQGKVQLYANRSCTDQLRKLHKISIKITNRERVDGLYVVTAQATMPAKGGAKVDEAIGAINIKGLGGEALANALMKCETKAKRRVTLSIMGLGMLDEIEAKEVAEREAKIATEIAVEQTTAALKGTTGRPEVEAYQPPPSPSVETEAPADTTSYLDYVMKSGRNKGKMLKQVPLRQLATWWKWYNDQLSAGAPLDPEIQDDGFHIGPFLDEAQTAPAGGPNAAGK